MTKFRLAAVALVIFASCTTNPYAQLDSLLDDKAEIDSRQKEKTDSMRLLFAAADSDTLRWARAEELYEEWRHLNLDSCALYTSQMLRYAGDNRSRIHRSECALVRTLLRSGKMDEALSVFMSIDLSDEATPKDIETYYYVANRLASQAPREKMDSLGLDINKLADDFLLRSDSSYKALLFKTKALRYENRRDEAIALTLSIDKDEIDDIYYLSTYYMTLCSIYVEKDEIAPAISYCLKASCVDIGCGMKDYFSLYMLAQLLFRSGDVQRAGKYMKRAVQDALEYNYPVGVRRSARAASMMDGAIDEMYHKQRRQMWGGIMVISLFLAIALVLLVRNRRMLFKVKRANRMYEDSQAALRSVSNIKDKMLGEYMELSSNYIYKVDENKSRYRKILKEQGAEALMAIFREPTFADAEYPHYWDRFDKIFLGIFPDFVEKVNELMKPENRFVTDNSESLSTELRILALIRLGITESKRISTILHISRGTVYTYRCVIRQNALDPDTFEDKVREIEDI